MHVQSVADQLRRDLLPLRGGADHTGSSVMDRRHGVEEMGQVAGAGVKDGAGGLIVRVRVGDGHGAVPGSFFGKVRRAFQLRRHIDNSDQPPAARIQSAKGLIVRQLQKGSVLRPLLFLREKGPFHVDARQPRGVRPPGGPVGNRSVKGFFQLFIGQGHGAGRKGGDAVPGIVVPHAPEALQIAVGKIRPGAAVGMDVDEAGDHEAAPEIDLLFPKGILRRGEASLPHGKVPVFEASVFSINVSVMIDHFHPSGGLSAAAL